MDADDKTPHSKDLMKSTKSGDVLKVLDEQNEEVKEQIEAAVEEYEQYIEDKANELIARKIFER